MIANKVNLNTEFFSNLNKKRESKKLGDNSLISEILEDSKDGDESTLTFKSAIRSK